MDFIDGSNHKAPLSRLAHGRLKIDMAVKHIPVKSKQKTSPSPIYVAPTPRQNVVLHA